MHSEGGGLGVEASTAAQEKPATEPSEVGARDRCLLQCQHCQYIRARLNFDTPFSTQASTRADKALSQAEEAQVKMRRWEANEAPEFFPRGTSV